MDLAEQLDGAGVAHVPGVLSPEECARVAALFDDDARFRSTVVMARHAFGEGTYRYFADPVPDLVRRLREEWYPPLAQIANRWAERLGERTFPPTLAGLRAECAEHGQRRPTPLLLRYGPGGHNRLHQDVYGDLTFPLQLLVMLSRPDVDFTGGESVFVEQVPRQQSRPIVVRPGRGDAVVFPVHHRPVRGARGDHRRLLRHGVSAVHTGERFVLGIIFHDAP
ncbi:2OG-Fe(II) oxygenase [Pseudonocardia sp. RS010]|uniref:2OG-Fe(II) oxygenase n=1 Tax=Pseudonocardia sp. RS010 TaxID=3385979 RepID=UPI0039A097A4